MKEVILHIGAHKTGSSAIQFSLKDFDDGITKYADLGPFNHSIPIYTIFSRRANAHQVWVKKGLSESEIHQKKAEYFERLTKEVTNKKRDRLIISGEGISILSKAEKLDLIKYFKDQSVDLKVICYVREPLSLAASSYQEVIKVGVKQVNKFNPKYIERISTFLTQLPNNNLVVREFSRDKLLDGDIVSDFCSAIGIKIENKDVSQSNVGLSLQALKLIALFNNLPISSFGTPKLFKARKKLIDIIQKAYVNSGKIEPKFFANLVTCPKGEIDFLSDNFGINFKAPKDDPSANLDDYLSDLSDIDEGVLDNVMMRHRLDPSVHKAFEEKLIALFYGILTEPPFTNRDVKCLEEVALKFETKELLTLSEANTLTNIARKAKLNHGN